MAAVVGGLLVLMALNGAEGGGGVPLVAWSSVSGLWSGPSAPPLPAVGHLVEDHQLGALLEPALTRGPKTLLLVLHDELSVEDFTAYGGGAFPRLQAALAAAGSVLQLTAVPGGAVGLPHTLGAESLLDDDAVGQLRAANGSGGALLLRLPRIDQGSQFLSPREVLASNDEALGEVLSALQAEGLPYSAVLTALRPSRVPHKSGSMDTWRGGDEPQSMGLGGGGRSLLQAPNKGRGGGEGDEPPPPLRWPPHPTPPQLLLWAENISVEYMGGGGKGEKKWDLTPRTFGAGADVDLGGSTWDPQEARLVLRYGDVGGAPLSITLLLRQRWFPVSGRRWFWLAEIDVKGGTSSSPSTNRSRFLSPGGGAGAPLGWSWRCDQLEAPGDYLDAVDQSGPWRIRIKGIQVQPFNVSGLGFLGASDCSSFLSVGSSMGLLLSLLLMAVSVHGGALLLRLRPMDRFDDPRGPTLHVPIGE